VVWLQSAADSCERALFGDDLSYTTCTGFDKTAYESLETLQAVAFVVGLLGAALLVRIQARVNSRPCPHCGHRVPNGAFECSCGFDFRRRPA